jgi:hypothetical protein
MSSSIVEESSVLKYEVAVRIYSDRKESEKIKIDDYDQEKLKIGTNRYKFNQLFDVNASQRKLFENCVTKYLDDALNGVNINIFTCGQHIDNKEMIKTKTMGLSIDQTQSMHLNQGIIYRSLEYLLTNKEINISAQFIEIHKNQVFDLIAPNEDILEPEIDSIYVGNRSEITTKMQVFAFVLNSFEIYILK